MTILEWIKLNAKEGANIAEAEELVSKSTFDGITTKDEALDFIGKNGTFTSAVDSLISTAVNRHDEKFSADKLPVLEQSIRDKVIAELNPDETPEQKRIRELEEKLSLSERKDTENALKSKLRGKATELGYDTEIAAKLSSYGDNAIELLESIHGYSTGVLETEKNRLINETLKGKAPKSVETQTDDITAEIIDAMSEADVANLFKG